VPFINFAEVADATGRVLMSPDVAPGDAYLGALRYDAASRAIRAVSAAAPPPVVVEAIFAAPTPPPANFSGTYRLGTVYQIKTAGSAIGMRMWHVAGNASTGRPLYLYDDTTGALLGTANIVEQPAVSEWCQANFAAPVPLAYNQTVVACFDETSYYGRVDPPGPTVTNPLHAIYVSGRYGTYQVPAKPDGNQVGYAYYADVIMEYPADPPAPENINAFPTPPPNIANGLNRFGMAWHMVVSGSVRTVRFYRHPSSAIEHRTMLLYDYPSGVLLFQSPGIPNDLFGVDGWVSVDLPTPFPLSAGQEVVLCYDENSGIGYATGYAVVNPAHATYLSGFYGPAGGTVGGMPTGNAGGYTYFVDMFVLFNAAVVVAQASAVPVVFANGLPFNEDGQLCVDPVAAPTSYNNGLAFSDIGALLIDPLAPVANHTHGWPVTAIGKVCQSGITTQSAPPPTPPPPVVIEYDPNIIVPIPWPHDVATPALIPPEPEPEAQSIQNWWQGVKIAARRLWGRLTEWVDPVLTWRVW